MAGDPPGAQTTPVPALDPVEVHSGIVSGERRSPRSEGRVADGSPREVLEQLLIEPLSNGPCHVAFSGGRDSSAMLAAATQVARKHGLPDPIPLTMRLADYPRTWETEWQDLVIGHLGLTAWNRFDVTTELDTLGDVACETLARYGVFWPSQAISMIVFSRQAGGHGSMLTGGGGDELFAPWGGRTIPMRRLAKLRPRRRAAKWMLFYSLPKRVQVEIMLSKSPLRVPWLRPEVEREIAERRKRRARGMNAKTWQEDLETSISSRYVELVRGTLDAFAADNGVALYEPFYDPSFVRAVGRAAPASGYASRTEALEAQFSDLLPPEVLQRGTKAIFTEVAWGPGARGFVGSWDGTGVDPALVDPEALRSEWTKERPTALSLSALHQAWVGSRSA